ncbi:MAG: carbohydrate ABC transporter permease, partial [Treponema sp.]|nr:carbohydrate ABC transporter permease [Treponema sp.]
MKKKLFIKKLILRIFMIVCTLLFLYPVIWNFIVSFKTNTEFLSNQLSLPKTLAWENYARAFVRANMGEYFINSLFVLGMTIVFLLIFVVPTSYVLSRFRFFGSRTVEALFMTCIFIQAAYIMVPLYIQMNRFRMVDNLFALSLVYAIMAFPYSIFLLCGLMRLIPKSYAEAAHIDGCSNWGILLRIMAPLAKPGIATVVMLAAINTWNEYPLALVVIHTQAKRTLPVGLAFLYQVQKRATDFGALFAALVIVLIPT